MAVTRSLAVRGAIDLTVMLNFIQLVIKADRYAPTSPDKHCLLNFSVALSELRRSQWPKFMNATWRDRRVHLQSELSGPGLPLDRSMPRWRLQVPSFLLLSQIVLRKPISVGSPYLPVIISQRRMSYAVARLPWKGIKAMCQAIRRPRGKHWVFPLLFLLTVCIRG